VPADITVRRADLAEADLVGALTERVYRDGGFGSGAYADVLRDGRSRVRDGIVLAATADGAIAGTVTRALPGTRLAHLCRADAPSPSCILHGCRDHAAPATGLRQPCSTAWCG